MSYARSSSGSVWRLLSCGCCSSVRRSFLPSLWLLLGLLFCRVDSALGAATCTLNINVNNCDSGQLNVNNYSSCFAKYPDCSGSSYASALTGNNGTTFIKIVASADGLQYGLGGTIVGKYGGTLKSVTVPCDLRGMNATITIDMATQTVLPPTTNSWCVYDVYWTNCGTRYAAPDVIVTLGNGTVEVPTSFTATVVRPGGVFHQVYTNNIGTNTYGCGYATVYDSRTDTDCGVVANYNGTRYSVTDNSAPSDGGGAGAGNGSSGPIAGTGTNSPGGNAIGSTNLATQHDIYTLIDANVQASAGLERTMGGVATNINLLSASMQTNFAGLNTNVKGVGTNVNTSGSNIVDAIRSLGTNLAGVTGTNGNGTNDDGGWGDVVGAITNFQQMVSNHWANEIAGYNSLITNLQSYTNLYSDWSNAVSGVSSNIGTIAGWGDGVGDGLRTGLLGLTPAEDEDPDFLVLKIPKMAALFPGGPPPPPGDDYYRLDCKPALSLQVIEDRFPGIRFWIKEIIIWGVLLWLVMRYMEELREALFQVLAIPAPGWSLAKSGAGALGAVAGPGGFAIGKAAGIVLSASQLIALVAVIAFFPSFLVAMMTTVTSDTGHGISFLVTSVTTLLTGPGSLLNRFLYYTSPWFPAVELMIFSANYIAVRLGINGTVSLMLVYRKVQTYVEST